MNVPLWVWATTVVVFLAVVTLDIYLSTRRRHVLSMRAAGAWVAVYTVLATGFALGLTLLAGPTHATEFVAGYLTEYSLSVDNLFVFMLIMSTFAVPLVHQHRVLLVGVCIALVLRGAFIACGATLIAEFSWVFYLFGIFLILTAAKVVTSDGDDGEFRENVTLRLLRRVVPVAEDYQGTRSVIRRRGRWMITPMLLVMVTIGTTDLLFALDSIPAVFGLTQNPYIVFTANMFALMGLRQLYFLLGGLLSRLIYLPIGLGLVLAFIGVKLILEALHTNTMPFLNSGRPLLGVPVPDIGLSLGVIIGMLTLTAAASLLRTRLTHRTSQPPAPNRPDTRSTNSPRGA